MNPKKENAGILIVSEGVAHIPADVIFVHGLGGHRVQTWSKLKGAAHKGWLRSFVNKRSDQPTPELFWPADLLAKDLQGVRIMSYGYDSDVLKIFRAADLNNIHQHAENMLWDIQRKRQNVEERPVIFVCHSLGGIIVKEALRLSKDSDHIPALRSLYLSTYGVIFMGTPHRGSTVAHRGTLMANLSILALQAPHKGIIRDLNVDSTLLQVIASAFSNMVKENKIRIHSFYEQKGMSGINGFSGKIVDDYSSIIGDAAEGKEGIDANHAEMCKFSSKEDNGYQKILGVIALFVRQASQLQTIHEEDTIDQGLAVLPVAVRKAIKADRKHNNLRVSPGSRKLVLDIPRFPEKLFCVSSNYPAPDFPDGGCSAFQLAWILELLQGQRNSHLLQTEEHYISDLNMDGTTYYGKVSRRGLLHLVCNHFSDIHEDGDSIVITTDIAAFTFVYSGHWSVRCQPLNRSDRRLKIGEQDFSELQRCASGQFRSRVGIRLPTEELPNAGNGTFVWKSVSLDLAVLIHDLDHPGCLRFMAISNYVQLQNSLQFASEILYTIDFLEERCGEAAKHMEWGFSLCRVLSLKRITNQEGLEVALKGATGIIHDA